MQKLSKEATVPSSVQRLAESLGEPAEVIIGQDGHSAYVVTETRAITLCVARCEGGNCTTCCTSRTERTAQAKRVER